MLGGLSVSVYVFCGMGLVFFSLSFVSVFCGLFFKDDVFMKFEAGGGFCLCFWFWFFFSFFPLFQNPDFDVLV